MRKLRACGVVVSCVFAAACGRSPISVIVAGGGAAGHHGGASAGAGGTGSPFPNANGGAGGGAGIRGGGAGGAGAGGVARDAGTPLPPVDGGAPIDGGTPSGDAGTPAGDGGVAVGRRLPLPCNAPLPTGFCFVSDKGDYIGGGGTSSGTGSASVRPPSGNTNEVGFDLVGSGGDDWDANFAAPGQGRLVPGLYDPAERYPFEMGALAGLSIDGNGRGCNTLSGKFSVEELARDPAKGIVRFSATFEQHCEGGAPALFGVVNYQATGVPDPTQSPSRVIALKGKVSRVAYDPTSNVAYGIDAANRRLARIDLALGAATYADVVQVPNDVCVDAKRGRLFVVNKGSSFVSEYGTSDLKSVLDIPWAGMDWGPTDTHFKIYCAPDKVYVVDGAWQPGLFTIEGLDGATPVVTDHSAQVMGVGGLAFNASATDLYTWSQVGWSAGLINTSVHRLGAADLSEADVTATNIQDFSRDPLDAPILFDETRELVFNKNKIFDATNLSKVIYTLPSAFDVFDGATENAYALDAAHGLLASKSYVYDLTRYDVVAPTLDPSADQLFFDAAGTLWFLSVANGTLSAQSPSP
jgi:hypothetical protein